MTVVQADNTLIQIRKKVRRLTSSPNETSLPTSEIDQYINSFYTQDFVYAIKIDQLREVQTLYTSPHIDRYSFDVNANQGVRSPVYFEGVEGGLYKDRNQFFNLYPRWPTKNTSLQGDGVTQIFSTTVGQVPFLRNEVVIGSVDISGSTIKVIDDGQGNLVSQENPSINSGTVDYITGSVSLNFTNMGVIPEAGDNITIWVVQYTTSRPRNILYWNNFILVRPVPDDVYKIEFESFLTPTQFMSTSDSPIIHQWKDYIAMGTSIKILEDRGDTEGVSQIFPMFERQEGLVLSRQSIEEIGQRNTTIYESNIQGYNNYGYNYGWY